VSAGDAFLRWHLVDDQDLQLVMFPSVHPVRLPNVNEGVQGCKRCRHLAPVSEWGLCRTCYDWELHSLWRLGKVTSHEQNEVLRWTPGE